MSFTIGETIGPYKIVAKLGQGGMATVYQAYQESLDRFVAIKVLHPTFKDDDSFLRRFSREAKVVARLEHPHIVPVYDFAQHEGAPYLVMRYVEGNTLKQRMGEGVLSPPEILRLARAVAEALDYAHQQGVLHRDVKPSNILLTTGGLVFIADFGLARIAQAGESTLSRDAIMGTPQYISPEQARGDKEIDGRTDLYSFGIVLYELITGRVPFQAETAYTIIHAQIFDPPPPPTQFNDRVSPALEAVLLKALSKTPAERYATAGELFAAFALALTAAPEQSIPTGAAALPDYTPLARTRIHEPADTPSPKPALPSLPDLRMPEAASTILDVPAPPVSLVKASRVEKRPFPWVWLGVGGGLLFICLLVMLVLNGLARNKAANGSKTDEVTTLTPSPVAAPPTDEGVDDADSPLFNVPDVIRPVAELEALLTADPDNRSLQAELALAYVQENRVEEARRLVQNLTQETRLPLRIHLTATNLAENGRLEGAELLLEVGMERFPNDATMKRMLIGVYLLRQVPPEKVQTFLTLSREQRHDEATIPLSEAYLAYRNGRAAEALDMLSSLIPNLGQPNAGEAFFLKGLILWEKGDRDGAKAAFNTARQTRVADWFKVQVELTMQQLGISTN